MARVLVTGGAGFIGSHVAERFQSEGYEVEVLDDLSCGRRENLPAAIPLVAEDVRSANAAKLIRNGRFDVVAHLAAHIDVRESVTDPLNDANANVLGTVNLLEAVRALRPRERPRVVFASTGGALYGDDVDVPTPETAATNPDSPYGVAKLTAEYYLAYYSRVWGIDHAVLRFGNVYGPRQASNGDAGVIAVFAKRILMSAPLAVYGDGSQTRDYVYVEDIADAFLLAATRDLPQAGVFETRAFNIGTGLQTSVLELAHLLASVAGIEPIVEHASPRRGELQRSMLDARKAQQMLGWRPRVQLRDGLHRTLAWLKAEMQFRH